jgi:Mu transposase, C-terminal
MSGNPFLVPASMTTVLDREDCQRIHYQALQAAVRGSRPEALPASVPLGELRERARFDGAEVYLAHPDDIERLFSGITLEVYRTVRSLFCSRLGRSTKMVWRILCAMACAAGMASIPYETVWALCLSLEERRLANVAVPIERGEDTWWVGLTTPDISIQQGTARAYRPSIAWCVEASRALSFCIAPLDAANENAARALYDAIMAQRRPQARVPTGLIWHLPERIMTTVPLSQSCVAACTRAGIQVEESTAAIPLLEHVRKTWEQGVAGRTLLASHCGGLLDAFLRRTHGYGPRRVSEQQAHRYASLVGYGQDPAWQFPLLRAFLRADASSIEADGAVAYDGLHYTHEWLSYWPGHAVTLRRSAHTGAVAWIYLDGEILCQAQARELRRRDGSYGPL